MSTKKCVVVDLDNTLWGGVVGEDGISGIKLSLFGEGAAFITFQQALLDLYNRGVILAINSRNNPDEALEVIRQHPDMILKENNFAARRINWNDKVANLKELSRELNIGLDSMVFLDDDETNRAMVRLMIPEVEVPELPKDPRDYARLLLSLDYFPQKAVTDEDKLRSSFYVTERIRKEAEKTFENREDFFQSLGLEMDIMIDDRTLVARLAQLTEKTNQFNVCKQPLTEYEITNLMNDPMSRVYCGRLVDRFGDYGIVILAVVRDLGCRWHLESFLMSCRVIGRGVEDAFLFAIAKAAKENNIEEISINFKKTEKNILAEKFVKEFFDFKVVPVETLIKPPFWINIRNGKI